MAFWGTDGSNDFLEGTSRVWLEWNKGFVLLFFRGSCVLRHRFLKAGQVPADVGLVGDWRNRESTSKALKCPGTQGAGSPCHSRRGSLLQMDTSTSFHFKFKHRNWLQKKAPMIVLEHQWDIKLSIIMTKKSHAPPWQPSHSIKGRVQPFKEKVCDQHPSPAGITEGAHPRARMTSWPASEQGVHPLRMGSGCGQQPQPRPEPKPVQS